MKLLIEAMRRVPALNSAAFEKAMLALSSGPVAGLVRSAERRKLRRIRHVERILVISDTNIGDSVLLKTALPVVARRLPHVAVDFACHHKVVEMMDPDPVIDRCVGLPGGGPEGAGIAAGRLVEKTGDRRYDLVLNFCPFISERQVGHAEAVVLEPISLAGNILRAYRQGEIAALPKHVVDFVSGVVDQLAGARARESDEDAVCKPVVFLSADHRHAARRWLEGRPWKERGTVVFVNPDCSNESTRVGVDVFADICRSLAEVGRIDGIVLGHGFTYPGVEREILGRMSAAARRKIELMSPDLGLAGFAALCDCCAVYVGADTGPLHIAAAHKAPAQPDRPLRNQTVVVGLFKATEPRIYGYCSRRADMIDSAQAAESTVFEGRPPCKNLTCSLQRLTKTCPALECGEDLNPTSVVDFIIGAVEGRVFRSSADAGGDSGSSATAIS